MNMLDLEGEKAVISFDPESGLFRGEFLGLAGGADFYADSVASLIAEGRKSLQTYFEVCRENGIQPRRTFSGKFNVRIPEALHGEAVQAAAARGISLNDLVREALRREVAGS